MQTTADCFTLPLDQKLALFCNCCSNSLFFVTTTLNTLALPCILLLAGLLLLQSVIKFSFSLLVVSDLDV